MLTVKSFLMEMLGENTYLLHDETQQAVLIDCGVLYPQEQQTIANYVAAHQLQLSQAWLTHGHFDHIFGCQWAYETFGIRPLLHPADEHRYQHSGEELQLFLHQRVDIPVPPLSGYLEDGQSLKLGNLEFEVIATPGHTPGGVCFYCAAEKVLISGDSLFEGSIGRCDLPEGDMDTLVHSLQTRIMTLPDDVRVYPGHGGSSTIGHERTTNPYFIS